MRGHQGYYRYWGKASAEGRGARYHLLPYHALDVAAAGEILLRQMSTLVDGLAEFLGVAADQLRAWLVALLSLHDVGKFADGFQNLRPDLVKLLQGRDVAADYHERHDSLGFRLLMAKNRVGVPVEILAGAQAQKVDREDLCELLLPWIGAVAGHHGRPPALSLAPRPLMYEFPDGVFADVLTFLRESLNLLLPAGAPFDLTDYDRFSRAFPRVSWLAAGLAVAADWVGSNEAWFPYVEEPMPLQEYWNRYAVPQAEVAVAESGLAAGPASVGGGIRGLFPYIEAPTPLQCLVEELELSDYPQLFIVEELTGGGKTEAALALAHRLMALGAADGLYLALPTMATANAMHRRVQVMFRRLFAEGASASLVLAHSASRMALDLEDKNREDEGPGRGEDTASRQCARWLADSRKKALLAHVGVGTIDQALLAVLAARHQSLRLFGLCRKVLIVDEVHACDAYVHRLLCTLLRFHAALGGSAVLLSATLPSRMREELTTAFGQSLGAERKIARTRTYPVVTHLTVDDLKEHPVEARHSARRRVGVNLHGSAEDVNRRIEAMLEAGRCVCWVRNTVDDALDAHREWNRRLGEDRVTLFHARFTLGDRLSRESEVLRLFGPDSSAHDRRGRLLIATQVVEQSLDLDFDGMVSDLAPIDLLIQRAGRLKRHPRDADGNRIKGRDLRGLPEFDVFLPEPVLDADGSWFLRVFPRAAWVYQHHGQLWLTARWLHDHRGFAMPEDARDMIEAVYGETAQTRIPAGLRVKSQQAEGDRSARSAQGRMNSLELEDGYVPTSLQWQEDGSAPTRLGDPTTNVRLAKWEGERLVPWCDGHPKHAWELSQLTVRKSRIAGEETGPAAPAADAARETMPDKGKHCVVIVLEKHDARWLGRAVAGDGSVVTVAYDARLGLQYLGE